VTNFEEIFERIKQATNTRTQVELAEVLDIRQSSISDAKRRNSVPSDWYMKLFEKFGLNPDWLKSAQGPMYLKTERGYEPYDGPPSLKVSEEAARYAEPDSKGTVITVHSMQVEEEAGGEWRPRSVGKLNVPQSYLRKNLLCLKMDASSMEPIIQKGAYMGVDKDRKNVVSGELFVVYVPYEGLAIKRIFLDADNDRFILRSEREGHPEQYLPVDKHKERIVGRVVWTMQQL
jgi:phage repressor protein C with HTH and peptisase S24 domain